MQVDNNTQDYVKEFIGSAINILIVSHNNGNDSLATGIALAKYIEKSFDKSPTVIYSGDFAHIDAELLSLYEVKEDFEPKSLKISLNYKDTQIETVNYYNDEENAQVVMEIKPVQDDFDTNRINYTFEGKEYDLVICVGVSSFADLGDIYARHQKTFDTATIINIDNSKNNQNYGKINIVNSDADSLASLLFAKFAEWQYIPDREVSQSLLVGMVKS